MHQPNLAYTLAKLTLKKDIRQNNKTRFLSSQLPVMPTIINVSIKLQFLILQLFES